MPRSKKAEKTFRAPPVPKLVLRVHRWCGLGSLEGHDVRFWYEQHDPDLVPDALRVTLFRDHKNVLPCRSRGADQISAEHCLEGTALARPSNVSLGYVGQLIALPAVP